MVDCIGFENRRNFMVTEGSNPSLSVVLSFFSVCCRLTYFVEGIKRITKNIDRQKNSPRAPSLEDREELSKLLLFF